MKGFYLISEIVDSTTLRFAFVTRKPFTLDLLRGTVQPQLMMVNKRLFHVHRWYYEPDHRLENVVTDAVVREKIHTIIELWCLQERRNALPFELKVAGRKRVIVAIPEVKP